MKTLTGFPVEQAHEVYDILVAVGKADERYREDFVADVSKGKGHGRAALLRQTPIQVHLVDSRWHATLEYYGDADERDFKTLDSVNESLDVAYRKFN